MNLTSFPVIALFSKYHLCCSTLTNKGSTFLKQQSQCLLSIHLREALRNKNIVGDRNARNSRSEGAKKSYHQDVLCCINHKQLMLLNGPYKDKKKNSDCLTFLINRMSLCKDNSCSSSLSVFASLFLSFQKYVDVSCYLIYMVMSFLISHIYARVSFCLCYRVGGRVLNTSILSPSFTSFCSAVHISG